MIFQKVDNMKSIKTKKLINIVFTILSLFAVQTFASKFGSIIADLFNYTAIDNNGVFMNISVHHIVQMLVALMIIFIISRKNKLEFHLKPKVDKQGIIHTAIFAGVILIYVLISHIVGYSLGTISPYGYELNTVNVVGTLFFQLFLSGTSEEILFRALPITILGSLICKDNKTGKVFIILIASALFSVAHISWTMFPFTLSFDWFQLVYAFILGIAYGVTYMKTKSVVYPMIMHGLSNFLMVGIGYIFMVVMN